MRKCVFEEAPGTRILYAPCMYGTQQLGAVVACWAHNPEDPGSNPGAATFHSPVTCSAPTPTPLAALHAEHPYGSLYRVTLFGALYHIWVVDERAIGLFATSLHMFHEASRKHLPAILSACTARRHPCSFIVRGGSFRRPRRMMRQAMHSSATACRACSVSFAGADSHVPIGAAPSLSRGGRLGRTHRLRRREVCTQRRC